MNRCLCLCLAVGVVVGSANDLWARGGGGGRGGARGGARPGGSSAGSRRPASDAKSRPSDRQGHQAGQREHGGAQAADIKNQFTQRSQNVAKSQPFSAAWYADHPRAWQYTHPHADAWAVATVGATAAWLGLAAINDSGTAYTGATEDEEDNAATGDELAEAGQVDLPGDEVFLPLGVFALSSDGRRDATAMVQLAVSKQGIVRGTYYDLLTDQEQEIHGAVDKQTRQVAFTVGQNGPVLFETSLANLTQAQGQISLEFANGRRQQWNLARYESPPAPRP